MDCKNCIQEISTYLDGGLDPDLKRTLEEHLFACRSCKVVVDTTRKTLELYCDGKLFELPIDVRRRLHVALERKWRERAP